MAIRMLCLVIAVLLLPLTVIGEERAPDLARLEEKVSRLEMQLERLQAVLVEMSLRSPSSGEPHEIPRLQDKALQTRVYNLVDLVDGGIEGFDGEGWIAVIKKAVPNATWKSDGGESKGAMGTISPFPTNLAVVVSQTPEVHADIANYLFELRQFKERLEKAGVVVKVSPPPPAK